MLARWRNLSQKQLRRLLLGSIVLHIGIGVYALAELPLFPIRPICRDGSIDYDTPRLWIEGPLAEDYLRAFEERFFPRMMVYGVDSVFVTLAEALDWSEIEKQSELATSYLLETRITIGDHREWFRVMRALPGTHDGSLTCTAIRHFADADGMFSKAGPDRSAGPEFKSKGVAP
jgi:hypothetical protein